MRRFRLLTGPSAAVVCAAVVLVGCGDSETERGSSAGSGGGTPAATVGGCAADAASVRKARPLTQADLDGDGAKEDVRLTGTGGECPSLVFAQVGESYVAGQIPVDAPPATSAFAVTVPGVTGDLVVTRQQHPRGGYQIRVFALGKDALVELRDGESPLLPFIATDVPERPLSIDCTAGGLVKTEAVAHEPRGVIFAWDVRRTTYSLQGGAVTRESSKEIADNVLPAQLDKRFPELAKYSLFASCRVG